MSNLAKMPATDKLAAGRHLAKRRMPYFTVALMRLAPKESHGLGTVGVTKHGVLMYDPAALDKWTVEETATVLIHEVSHLLRKHHSRCEKIKATDAARWNLSADAEINDDLEEGKQKFPTATPPVLPQTLNMATGLTAEAYYHGPWQTPPSPSSPGAPADSAKGPASPPPSGAKAQGAGCGWCGSGAGRELPGEPKQDDPANRSDAELEAMRREVANAINDHVQRSRG
jgi:hypothetical protein